MEVVGTRTIGLARTEAVLCGVLAAAVGLAVAALVPPGGDTAAHLYRTLLVREGMPVWDNLWYAGHYPLASYSLLYYLPAALFGNVPVVLASVAAAGALFAALAADEWGDLARWPARLFAVAAAGPLFTGTYSYALGVAAALAALRLLQVGRRGLAVLAAAAALAASPLAFAFLALALAAILAVHRPAPRQALALGAGLAAVVGAQVAVLLAFPSEGRYPFSTLSLAGVLAVSALTAAVALRSRRARLLGAFFALWGLANLGAWLVASPFGDNLARLRGVLLPLVLLAVLLAGLRPRPLAVAALAVALVYNVGPDVLAYPKRVDDRPTAEAAFWRPALGFLDRQETTGYRVEVVPTFGHWEAWFVPRAGFALARGWYRQIDLAANPVLYADPLEPGAYRAWLRANGVRFVLLPQARLGPMGADREAALLRSGRAGLEPVFRSRDWTVYELPDATPVLTGPAASRLDRLAHDRIAGAVAAPGEYRLAVRWNRWWSAEGAVCVRRAPDGTTILRAERAGSFVLTVGAGSGRCR